MAADEPIVIENWERQRILGSGGFGVVTLWKNKATSQFIAVKKCRYDLYPLMNPKQQERWEKEVEIMLRLEHQNVVKAMNVPDKLFEDALRRGAASLPLLCMEFCSRGDLRQVLNKAENCCGLKERDVRNLIRDVASAVKYLHSLKITHRDLKPENIVLQEENDRIVYKLIDLGYAKELDQSSNCASFVGTLQYLAPELFMSQKYGCSVDYWSLGLVSHEVITGVRPFLPSKPPVAWMNLVQNKTSKDICAYQDYDGNVIFSSELYPENHISLCLKYYMEQWLQFCLEWDSKIRGRSFNKGEEGRVVVFDMLDEILTKKMVYVFCLPTYDVLSYEVEESTRLRTLQGWVERDTNIPVEQQEILSVHNPGKYLDPDGPALAPEFFQTEENRRKCDECSLFIFLRDSFETPKVTPRWPVLVEKMMQDTRRSLEYPLQKRTWASAVFFLQQEASLYRHFLHAYKIKMLHLFGLSCKLSKLWQKLYADYQHVLSQFELFMRSINLDENSLNDLSSVRAALDNLVTGQVLAKNCSPDRISHQTSTQEAIVSPLNYYWKGADNCKFILQQKGLGLRDACIPIISVPISITKTWFQNQDTLSSRMSMLVQAVTLQEKKCAAIAAKVSYFKSNPAPRDTPYQALEPLVQSGQKCFEQLCRRPKEERNKKSKNVDMVKIVYVCLKERDKLLMDKAFQTHLGSVMDCQMEMEQFMDLLTTSIEQTSKLKKQLWTYQSERQRDIWEFVNNRVLNNPSSDSPRRLLPQPSTTPTNCHILRPPLSDMERNFQGLSIGDSFDQLRSFDLHMSVREDENSTTEGANEMLNENYSLRSKIQELMNEAFDRVKSVVNEPIDDMLSEYPGN